VTKGIKGIDIFSKNIILVFLGTTLANILNLFFQMYIAHRLIPTDFAAFNSLISIFVLLSSPLTTLQAAVAKYSSQFYALNEDNKMRVLLSGLLKKASGFAIVTFLIFYLSSFYITEKLKIPSVACGYILAILLASAWITPILLGSLQGQELFKWFSAVVVITAALKLVFSFIFIPLGFNISGALSAVFLSSLIGILISFLPIKNILCLNSVKADVNLARKAAESNNSAIVSNKVNFKEIFKYMFPVAISFFCFMNLVNMDMILVKYYFSPQDSAFYSLAQMVGKIFLFLPFAISIVMFPRTSGLSAKNMDTVATLKRSLLYAAVISIFANLFYNIFPGSVLRILTGKAFYESIVLGRLFSISMVFFTFLFILINYFLSVKDLRFIKYLVLFTILQFFAIVFFHNNLMLVQKILCVNSISLFLIHFLLVNFKKAIPACVSD